MDNLRLPLLIALTAVSYLLWDAWQEDYATPVNPAAVQQQAQAESKLTAGDGEVPGINTSNNSEPDELDVPAANTPLMSSSEPTTAGQVANAEKIRVETDLLTLSISSIGASIVNLNLPGFPQAHDDETPYQLMNDVPPYVLMAQSGLAGKQLPSHNKTFRSEAKSYQLAAGDNELRVPFRWAENGVEVVKTYVFARDSYQVTVEWQITNNSGETLQASPYTQFQRSDASNVEDPPLMKTFKGAVYYRQEKPEKAEKGFRYRKMDFGDLEDGINFKSKDGWAGMMHHYFLVAAIPPTGQTNSYYGKRAKSGLYISGVVMPALSIANGSTGSAQSKLFLGPKLQNRLPEVAPGLERAVDYGFLTVVAEPLFWVLKTLYKYVGNWGVAIILLTLLIKLVFYKLSEAQYRSMARMRKFTPRIKALKERYGDDRQKMQQAMMKLYKEEKFNPLGGCWPMLVQIPVFIALYWVLLESVELRSSPFFLWVDDLSNKDPYFVLPILMGGAMMLQQKLSSASMSMDPMQQKIMTFMPVMMTAFMAFFPAGLVLYWLTNTVLGLLQQWYITRKIEAEAG